MRIRISFRRLKILSGVIFIPALISLILWAIGKLDVKYMIVVNYTVLTSETIIFFLGFMMIKNHLLLSSKVTVTKASCGERSIDANTPVFNFHILPTNPMKDCIFRILLEIEEYDKPTLFFLIRSCYNDTCTQTLNEDIDIHPGAEHIFEVCIDRKEKLNFKFDKKIKIKSLKVEELYPT